MLSRTVKRHRPLVVAYYLQKDLRARLAQRGGAAAPINVHTSGRQESVEASAANARKIFSALMRHAGLDDLSGRRVLELGPGDDLGLALLALGAGASEVVALDRFAVRRDAERSRLLGEALGVPGGTPTVVEGIGVEEAGDEFGQASFDFVYSVAVLEHVGDLEGAFGSMATMLRPGGVMVHYIGGGDHGMFTDGGQHPLTYLQIPAWLYRQMTAHSGGPNRVFPSAVRRIVEPYGWEWDLSLTQVLGRRFLDERQSLPLDVGDFPEITRSVESVRRSLREPFRSFPASELMVEGCLLVARAPASGALS